MNFSAIIQLIIFVLLFSANGLAQNKNKNEDRLPSTPEEIEREYKRNIRKSRINGVYIPKDLDDALQQLKKLSSEESLAKFKNAPEDIVAKKLHFGLGRWMIYNWNFYYGSRLEYYLKQKGLMHPDDMADFLIISFHRYLNNKDLNTGELIKKFNKKRWEVLKKKFKTDTLTLKKSK